MKYRTKKNNDTSNKLFIEEIINILIANNNKNNLIEFCLSTLKDIIGNFENCIFPIIKNDNKIIIGAIIFNSKIL